MYPTLKKFSNLFIVLAIISFICAVCVFLSIIEQYLFPNLDQFPFLVFCLLFAIFTGPIIFTCLAVLFRILHRDLGSASYATHKRIDDLKNQQK